jgi:hypothetical protein
MKGLVEKRLQIDFWRPPAPAFFGVALDKLLMGKDLEAEKKFSAGACVELEVLKKRMARLRRHAETVEPLYCLGWAYVKGNSN